VLSMDLRTVDEWQRIAHYCPFAVK
jgi:hypothetical protein